MVIPWVGYSMSEFISAMEPLPSAKYVQFLSDDSKKDMPDKAGGLRLAVLRRAAHGLRR